MTKPQVDLFRRLKAERAKPEGFSHPAWDDVFAATEAGTANTAGANWVITNMLEWPRQKQ